MDETRYAVRAFLAPFFKDQPLADNEDIFALGIVNSLFAMQLVLFVERKFHIALADEDLDIENFRSINAVAQLVARKQQALGVEVA